MAVDRSPANVAEARRTTAGLSDVTIIEADMFGHPFAEASLDHVFVCFLLKHVRDPEGTFHYTFFKASARTWST